MFFIKDAVLLISCQCSKNEVTWMNLSEKGKACFKRDIHSKRSQSVGSVRLDHATSSPSRAVIPDSSAFTTSTLSAGSCLLSLLSSWLSLWCVFLWSLRVENSTGTLNSSLVQVTSIRVLSNTISDCFVCSITSQFHAFHLPSKLTSDSIDQT